MYENGYVSWNTGQLENESQLVLRRQLLPAERKNHTFLSCSQIYFLIHNAILLPRPNYLFLFRYTLFKSNAGCEGNRSEPEKQILSQMQIYMPYRRPTCHVQLHTVWSVFETLNSSPLSHSCSQLQHCYVMNCTWTQRTCSKMTWKWKAEFHCFVKVRVIWNFNRN